MPAPVGFGQREPIFLPLDLWCRGTPEFEDQRWCDPNGWLLNTSTDKIIMIMIIVSMTTCSCTWGRLGGLAARFGQWTRTPGRAPRLNHLASLLSRERIYNIYTNCIISCFMIHMFFSMQFAQLFVFVFSIDWRIFALIKLCRQVIRCIIELPVIVKHPKSKSLDSQHPSGFWSLPLAFFSHIKPNFFYKPLSFSS